MGHSRLSTEDHSSGWPSFLKKLPRSDKSQDKLHKPLVFDMSKTTERELAQFVAKHKVSQVIDNYDEQFGELLLSRDAYLYKANYDVQVNSVKKELKSHYGKKEHWQLGSWVYFPWDGRLMHILREKEFNELRTTRNKELITETEQKKFREFNIGCVGMSVGSSSALAIGISGGSKKIKLADGAVISGSNLNRILTGVKSVGLNKEVVISRKLYEMNPYMDIELLEGPISKENISEFFDKPWPIDLIVDEIDDLEMKILIRLEAKKRAIPVVMATELGDNVMLDVERFDLDKEYPVLHGIIKNPEQLIGKEMSQREWMKHASEIIGIHNMSLSLQHSLMKIGSRIVTHPQLGSTVMVTGGIVAYITREIANGSNIKSGRSLVNFEKVFDISKQKRSHQRTHKKNTKAMKKAMKSM